MSLCILDAATQESLALINHPISRLIISAQVCRVLHKAARNLPTEARISYSSWQPILNLWFKPLIDYLNVLINLLFQLQSNLIGRVSQLIQ